MTTETGIALCNYLLVACYIGAWLVGMVALFVSYADEDDWVDDERGGFIVSDVAEFDRAFGPPDIR